VIIPNILYLFLTKCAIILTTGELYNNDTNTSTP
jgi:hypothetical protein